MNISFFLAQAIGLLTTVIAIISVQFKNVKLILISQIILNLLVAANFALLGGLSGAWICILAAVQTAITFFIEQYCGDKATRIRNILLPFFAAGYVIGTVIVYKDWNDIVSCVCAILYVIAILQTESSKYRKVIILNALLWVIYDFTTMAYTSILTHGLEAVSIFIAMIRLKELPWMSKKGK
ncbi:MAG: YgjV family protein [Lachnospiraceae bacterium]|nr:YgjV family protein [Lachnospiraceae bacterium]